MSNPNKFRVEVAGSFYTYELYDDRGRECFDVDTAANAAEQEYGIDWQSVYNGQVAIDRESWLEKCRKQFCTRETC